MPLLCLLCLPLDPLDLYHYLIGQLIYALGYTILDQGFPRRRCLISETKVQLHVECVIHLVLLLFCCAVLIMYVFQLTKHLSDEVDLLVHVVDLDTVPGRFYVLLIFNDLQVTDLDVLLELIELVVVLFKQTQKLTIVVLCEVEVLVSLRERLLQL